MGLRPPQAGKVQDPCSCVYLWATGETKQIKKGPVKQTYIFENVQLEQALKLIRNVDSTRLWISFMEKKKINPHRDQNRFPNRVRSCIMSTVKLSKSYLIYSHFANSYYVYIQSFCLFFAWRSGVVSALRKGDLGFESQQDKVFRENIPGCTYWAKYWVIFITF
jgi:hypothetical protein